MTHVTVVALKSLRSMPKNAVLTDAQGPTNHGQLGKPTWGGILWRAAKRAVVSSKQVA